MRNDIIFMFDTRWKVASFEMVATITQAQLNTMTIVRFVATFMLHLM